MEKLREVVHLGFPLLGAVAAYDALIFSASTANVDRLRGTPSADTSYLADNWVAFLVGGDMHSTSLGPTQPESAEHPDEVAYVCMYTAHFGRL
jgi:hypothetical protein